MREAQILSRYLLGVPADARAIALYDEAVLQLHDASGGRDERVVSFACDYPIALGLLDGALALRDPDSLLRRKLHLMLAILETRPAYSSHFLSTDRSPAYALCIAYFGLRAALKAVAGLILLRCIP